MADTIETRLTLLEEIEQQVRREFPEATEPQVLDLVSDRLREALARYGIAL